MRKTITKGKKIKGIEGKEKSESKSKAEALLREGERKLKEKKYDEARKLFSEAISTVSDMHQAYYRRAFTYCPDKSEKNQDFILKALGDISIAIRDAGNDKVFLPDYYDKKGELHLANCQFEDAYSDFTQSIKIATQKPDGKDDKVTTNIVKYYYHKAIVSLKMNKLNKAVEDLKIAKEREGSSSSNQATKINFKLGVCYRKLGNISDAIILLKQAADSGIPNGIERRFCELGLALFDNQNYNDALDNFKKAIEKTDFKALFINYRGVTQYKLGEYDLALKEFNEAIKLANEHRDAIDKKDKTISKSKVEKELKFISEYYYNRALVELCKKNFDNAIKDFDTAISINPNVPKYYHNKGLAFQKRNEPTYREKAIEMFNLAISHDNDFDPAYLHLGIMYHKVCKYEDSIKHFTKALEINKKKEDSRIDDLKAQEINTPSRVQAERDKFIVSRGPIFLGRGKVFQEMGNHTSAILDFEEACKIDLNDPKPEVYKGISKIKLKKYIDAEKIFNSALEKYEELSKKANAKDHSKKLAMVKDGLGFCYLANKDYTHALECFSSANTYDPNNCAYIVDKAQAFTEYNKHDMALLELEKALELNSQDPQIYYKLGLSNFQKEKYSKAIKVKKMIRTLKRQSI